MIWQTERVDPSCGACVSHCYRTIYSNSLRSSRSRQQTGNSHQTGFTASKSAHVCRTGAMREYPELSFLTFKRVSVMMLKVRRLRRAPPSSRRPEEAQRGAQALLDLLCGCHWNPPMVRWGGFSVGPEGKTLQENPLREHSSNNITVHWSRPSL